MENVFLKHRNALAQDLNDGDLAIFFAGHAPKSTADAHYDFKTNKNFFYLTGLKQEHFKLVLLKKGDLLETVLFIEKPDYDVEKWVGRKLKKEVATEISGIENVQYLEAFERQITQYVHTNKARRLFLDLEKLSWDEAHSIAHLYGQEFQKRFPHVPLASVHPLMTSLRMKKCDFEVQQVQKAIELTKQGLDAIMDHLKPGMMEYQLASIFAHTIRFQGADGNSFPTIAAAGQDAVILHYVENNKAVENGDLLLLDLGAQYQEYCADISRTYPVSGKFSEAQKKYYNMVLKAMDEVIAIMKPGVPFTALNIKCREVLAELLIADGLIEDAEGLSRYYYHGVSHHLGLDVHDLSDREGLLAPGMIFTVEPGLYIAEKHIGIRIEDDILITETGCVNLSSAIPKRVEDIEAYMARGN